MISKGFNVEAAKERCELKLRLWKEFQISREITKDLSVIELKELIDKQKPKLEL